MKLPELVKSIGFRERRDSFDRLEITGGLILQARKCVPMYTDYFACACTYARESITHEILGMMYEDRRTEFMELIYKMQSSWPCNAVQFIESRDRLMELAQYSVPKS